MNNIVCLGNAGDHSQFSETYEVLLDGRSVPVYRCEVASYAICCIRGRVLVEVRAKEPFREIIIRPLSAGILFEQNGSTVRFPLDSPAKLSIELDGDLRDPLFLLANPPETEACSSGDPGVIYFEGGKAYDVGVLTLRSGETAYLAEGALVFGAILAEGADNVTVRGQGRLDGSRWPREGENRQMMLRAMSCGNVLVEGVTVVGGPTWHIVPAGCRHVRIGHVNVITSVWTGDGIDIVGCEDVTVDNCFVRSTDDCVAIKACDYLGDHGLRDVRNVSVTRSVFWNAELGNALEIGFETRCVEISNVQFADCDVIHCEFEGYQSGGVFTIHNGDRAVVHGVRYEDIRVEDAREKLIDLKIQWAQYSKDGQRGQVHDIMFSNIQVVGGLFPVSIIRGFGLENIIRNVTFDTLVIHGEHIRSANEARMVMEVTDGIVFR